MFVLPSPSLYKLFLNQVGSVKLWIRIKRIHTTNILIMDVVTYPLNSINPIIEIIQT